MKSEEIHQAKTAGFMEEARRHCLKLIEEKDFEEAHNYLLHLSEVYGESPSFHFLQGEIFETQGRLRQAFSSFEKAFALERDNFEHLYWIAEIKLMMYDIPLVLEYCRMGEELFPQETCFKMVAADAWQWKISIEALTGFDREEALRRSKSLLDQCIEKDPKNGEVRVIEGTCRLQQGKKEEAVKSLESALEYGLELYGDYVDVRLILAILYLNANLKNKAFVHLNKAKEILLAWNEPHYLRFMLHYEHIVLLLERHFDITIDHSEAEEFYSQYKKLMDKGMRVHPVTRDLRENIMDYFRYRKCKKEEAAEHLKTALDLLKKPLALCIIFNTIKKPSLTEILQNCLREINLL